MCHIVTRKPPEPPEPPREPEKKERVIHTRVPERLEVELRQRAQDLGISVSNLVRNVLGHAFGLVGDVVADSHAIARAARGDREAEAAPAAAAVPPPAGPPSLGDVVAWQAIVLAKNAVCARCNALLPKGDPGAVGIVERGGPGPIVCSTCMEETR